MALLSPSEPRVGHADPGYGGPSVTRSPLGARWGSNLEGVDALIEICLRLPPGPSKTGFFSFGYQ